MLYNEKNSCVHHRGCDDETLWNVHWFTRKSWLSLFFSLESVAVCCSVLQCAAVCCSVLQCAAVCCSVLQCVVVCCNVLQCAAMCCSVLQRAAVCCSVLQCVAVHALVTRCTLSLVSYSSLRLSNSFLHIPLIESTPLLSRKGWCRVPNWRGRCRLRWIWSSVLWFWKSCEVFLWISTGWTSFSLSMTTSYIVN